MDVFTIRTFLLTVKSEADFWSRIVISICLFAGWLSWFFLMINRCMVIFIKERSIGTLNEFDRKTSVYGECAVKRIGARSIQANFPGNTEIKYFIGIRLTVEWGFFYVVIGTKKCVLWYSWWKGAFCAKWKVHITLFFVWWKSEYLKVLLVCSSSTQA